MRSLETIIERLKSRMSKAEILGMAKEIETYAIDFEPLFHLLHKDNPLAMRSAWLIENLVIPSSEKQVKYFNPLAEIYLATKSSSVRRNIGKTLSHCSIPEHWDDALYDFCTKLIVDSNEVVAAKVHAMIIAANISIKYPELIHELKATIEGEVEKNTVAYKGAAKRAFKLFKKAGY
ncbi:MAG: hypothetical protein JXQ87_15940 [Bacteroidia bacterium]